MNRTYILIRYNGEDCFERIIGAWERKYNLLHYAENNNITQQEAYVIVVLCNHRNTVKFIVRDWQDQKTWKQPC